jgi:hypothetical protein
MTKTFTSAFLGLLISAAWLAAAGPIQAATTYKASLVPVEANTTPGFSARGSSIKIVSNNQLRIKGKIKGVVDVDGNRVTTQPGTSTTTTPSRSTYSCLPRTSPRRSRFTST